MDVAAFQGIFSSTLFPAFEVHSRVRKSTGWIRYRIHFSGYRCFITAIQPPIRIRIAKEGAFRMLRIYRIRYAARIIPARSRT